MVIGIVLMYLFGLACYLIHVIDYLYMEVTIGSGTNNIKTVYENLKIQRCQFISEYVIYMYILMFTAIYVKKHLSCQPYGSLYAFN
ncbi:MAG: hypothetical protein EA343_22675 [Nodularia sp. (in: Bacteria)]|nr:MAG: hypothetical protein EA343_22675 [Nodularia sp. (in: cyanobacteria)]